MCHQGNACVSVLCRELNMCTLVVCSTANTVLWHAKPLFITCCLTLILHHCVFSSLASCSFQETHVGQESENLVIRQYCKNCHEPNVLGVDARTPHTPQPHRIEPQIFAVHTACLKRKCVEEHVSLSQNCSLTQFPLPFPHACEWSGSRTQKAIPHISASQIRKLCNPKISSAGCCVALVLLFCCV